MSDKDGFKDISGKQLNLTVLFSNPDDLSGESFRVVSRFKHRIAALIIDVLLLAILGAIMGLVLGDRAFLLGPWGLLLGFVISVLYFGLQNTCLRKGQTVGKKLMKIQVVTAAGKYLSLPLSLIRAMLLVSPLFVLQNNDR